MNFLNLEMSVNYTLPDVLYEEIFKCKKGNVIFDKRSEPKEWVCFEKMGVSFAIFHTHIAVKGKKYYILETHEIHYQEIKIPPHLLILIKIAALDSRNLFKLPK